MRFFLRNDLDDDPWHPGNLGKVVHLSDHHGRAADIPVQQLLVHECVNAGWGWVLTEQDGLPFEASL